MTGIRGGKIKNDRVKSNEGGGRKGTAKENVE